MTQPIQIFFSYAHQDELLMNAVRQQLCLFERQLVTHKWYDRMIPTGTEWRGQIDDNLRSAGVIVLFISPAFINSDYCFDVEMTEALRRHDAGEARVIPIILRPCPWEEAPFSRLQVLPRDGEAITAWADRDAVCLDVARGIMAVVRELTTKSLE